MAKKNYFQKSEMSTSQADARKEEAAATGGVGKPRERYEIQGLSDISSASGSPREPLTSKSSDPIVAGNLGQGPIFGKGKVIIFLNLRSWLLPDLSVCRIFYSVRSRIVPELISLIT